MGFGLNKFDTGAITRRLVLSEISADPSKPIALLVRYAGVTNKLWDNFMLRTPASAGASGKSTAGLDTPDALAAERSTKRAADRAFTNSMLAETIIAGWENVSEDGEPIASSPDAVLRFLGELAEKCPDVWNRIQLFVVSISNFRDVVSDAVALGKE